MKNAGFIAAAMMGLMAGTALGDTLYENHKAIAKGEGKRDGTQIVWRNCGSQETKYLPLGKYSMAKGGVCPTASGAKDSDKGACGGKNGCGGDSDAAPKKTK